MKLIIRGGASGRSLLEFSWDAKNEQSLMDNLTKLNLPIASSCGGVGGCQKCVIFLKINDKNIPVLSCQISYDSFIKILAQENKDEKTTEDLTLELSYL